LCDISWDNHTDCGVVIGRAGNELAEDSDPNYSDVIHGPTLRPHLPVLQ
jgi:hypothetical protein